MLREAKEDLPDGIYIRLRTDGRLFNLPRLLARTKTTEEFITELLFADDCALWQSLVPPLHKDPSIQGRRRSHPPVRCRDLSSISVADQATGAISPTLLALHPLHQMARPRVERRSPQESQPAHH